MADVNRSTDAQLINSITYEITLEYAKKQLLNTDEPTDEMYANILRKYKQLHSDFTRVNTKLKYL